MRCICLLALVRYGCISVCSDESNWRRVEGFSGNFGEVVECQLFYFSFSSLLSLLHKRPLLYGLCESGKHEGVQESLVVAVQGSIHFFFLVLLPRVLESLVVK